MKKSHFFLISFLIVGIYIVFVIVSIKNNSNGNVMGIKLHEDNTSIEEQEKDDKIYTSNDTNKEVKDTYIPTEMDNKSSNQLEEDYTATETDTSIVDIENNSSIEEVSQEQEELGIHIINDELLNDILVSEDSEALLYTILSNQFKESMKERVEITILPDSIINNVIDISFIFYTNKSLYYELKLYPYTSDYEITKHNYRERIVDNQVKESIKLHQESYKKEMNNEETYSTETLILLDDYVLDFYLSCAIGRFKESYDRLSHDELEVYIKDYKYEYYDFVQDMNLLEEQCTKGTYDAVVQGYIKKENYYLANIYIYNNGKILDDKWITIFYDNEDITGIWLEDIECIEIWKNNFR